MNVGIFDSFRRCLTILNSKDQKKYVLVLLLQAFLGIFDLVGVAIAGIIGSLSVRNVQSQKPGTRVEAVLNFVGVKDLSFQRQILILGVLAIFVLISKTVFSIVITRRILVFLANRSSDIASDLISRTLNQPISGVQSQNTTQFQFAMGMGISSITMGILGVASTAISDIFLILILVLGILYVDPIMAISIILLFGITGFSLNRVLRSRARLIGKTIVESEILTARKISEVRSAYREVFVRNKRNHYASEISRLKSKSMQGLAEQTFLPNIGKYVFEIAILLGAALTATYQVLTQDVSHAAASLTLFLVAASRLAPAFLRLQQSMIQIQTNFSAASETLQSFSLIKKIEQISKNETAVDPKHQDFCPKVIFSHVFFRYPGSSQEAVSNISFEIEEGSMTAIVGSSGAGKSTLADLILGIQNPTEGRVLISGLSPSDAINKWPGAVGYVPQEVGIFEGSVRENLAFGLSESELNESVLAEALRQSHLQEFLDESETGLAQQVGERGSKLSGGQKQRLGIARALLTNPKLVVMDEATSALDAITENDVKDSIQRLKGRVTLIVIAHRLSVIRSADQIVYMNKGRIEARGTFEEVRSQVPDFDSQARIMGL